MIIVISKLISHVIHIGLAHVIIEFIYYQVQKIINLLSKNKSEKKEVKEVTEKPKKRYDPKYYVLASEKPTIETNTENIID